MAAEVLVESQEFHSLYEGIVRHCRPEFAGILSKISPALGWCTKVSADRLALYTIVWHCHQHTYETE